MNEEIVLNVARNSHNDSVEEVKINNDSVIRVETLSAELLHDQEVIKHQ